MDSTKLKVKGGYTSGNKTSSSSGRGNRNNVGDWETRPGGMLVQKRDSEPIQNSANSIPMIKVRVKFGSLRHVIHINSQASFGELKKALSESTGVHHMDQKLMYKKKARDSKEYLDVVGVKDGSKIVLIEDTGSRERRCLELIKSANVEKVKKSLHQISTEVDNLQEKVATLEANASSGGKVAEGDVDKMIEILMNKLVELDRIKIDGDLNLEKKMQERRVQKHIETLDLLKVQCSKKNKNGLELPPSQQENLMDQMPLSIQKQPVQSKQENVEPLQQQKHPLRRSESVVITTKWETFD